MKTEREMEFDCVLRFRVPAEVKIRLERIARKRFKTLPELAREAAVNWVEEQERELGLEPKQDEEDQE